MLKTLLLVWVSLLFCFSYSNAEDYTQQYQVGDTGPNGGTVTDVVVTSALTDSTTEIIGDFLEQTDTYVYTETITESVQQVTYETVEVTTEVTTNNLLTTELQDTATMTNTHDCTNSTNCYGMNGADFTTGNQGQGGGSAIINFDLSDYDNMQEIEYGGTVYSHESNATVPLCSNTSGDCKDEFKVTVTLKDGNDVVKVYTHNYTNISWTGSQDYSFTQDVSNEVFSSADLEFYGIDRGFNNGYYGPGLSDAFFLVTWNKIEEIINEVINFVTMETIKNTTLYDYKSDYIPPVETSLPDFEPIETVEVQFEVKPEEVMTFEIEVKDLETGVVEVQLTTEFNGEIEIETIETIEVFDMPEINMTELEMPEMVDLESAGEIVEVAPEEVQESNSDAGQRVADGGNQTDSESSESELQSETEPEREVDDTTEPEPEPEPDRQDDRGSSDEDGKEADEKEVEEKETKEEKVKTSIAKAKQKVAQKILAKIVSQNDTLVLDSTKLALMVALSDTKGFNAYQQKQLDDAMFYISEDIYNIELNDNPAGNLLLYGTDRLMDQLIDQQYGD